MQRAASPRSKVALLHGIQQRRYDPGSGGADGMTQGHRAAVDVDLLGIEAEFTIDCQGDGRKRFIDLEQIDVTDGKSGLFQQPPDRFDRRNREPFRCQRRTGIPDDASHRRETKPNGLLFTHDDQCCRSIVAGGGVAHGEDSVVLKHRFELAQLGQIHPIRFFVVRDEEPKLPFSAALRPERSLS
jgi:hypothetical protein